MTKVSAGASIIEIDSNAVITAAEYNHRRVDFLYASVSVSGVVLEPHHLVRSADDIWRFSVSQGDAARAGQVAVSAETTSGSLRYASTDDGMELLATLDAPAQRQEVSLTVALPDSAKIHLPDGFNLFRMFDSEMPVGRSHVAKKGLNFCVVELNEMTIAVRTEDNTTTQKLACATRTVARTDNGFLLSIEIPSDQRIVLSCMADLDAARIWFTEWMHRGAGVRSRHERAGKQWIDATRLEITVDMLRSNGEVAHSYSDLENLAGELAAAGCPAETLFYIPGWNGPYDAAYPDYLPREELGGEAAFSQMVDVVHRHGFRVMIHTNPDGLDPYHRDIDSLIKYALKDKDGRFAGFQTPSATKMGFWGPPFRFLPYGSGRQPIVLEGPADDRRFGTVEIPMTCEACITIGGLSGVAGRVSISHKERTMRAPDGWFANNDEYRFPFSLRLGPEGDSISLGGIEEMPEGVWYRIHDCRVPVHPASIWTYPILATDVANDEWVRLVIGNIASIVEKYDIDAIHCDAADFEPTRKYFEALRDRLPDRIIGCEYFSTVSGYGFFDLSQSWRNQSLFAHDDSFQTATDFHEILPDAAQLPGHFGWLNKASPLTGLTDRYTRIYPHLCHADGFVPVGKVCTCTDASAAPFDAAKLRALLDDAPRLGYIPGLRVNYRDYGLDPATEDYVRSLSGESETSKR